MRKYIVFILAIFLLITCKSPPAVVEVEEHVIEIVEAEIEPEVIPDIEIEILEPEFTNLSILILQADLVVTEFETTLRVVNPNTFAVELSRLTYELYGNGSFWASGSDNNILVIPALSSGETKFTFKMNFIDMNRRLLDDVIALRPINYRFRGQAQVLPDIPNYPAFITDFDCSGISEVRRR